MRYFYIENIDCISIVEFYSRKELLSYMDEYIENMAYDWYDASDDTFSIQYEDGSIDYINEEYDGHHIKRQHIVSIVWNNPCTAIVYGGFNINEHGVVTVNDKIEISNFGIMEVGNDDYKVQKFKEETNYGVIF